MRRAGTTWSGSPTAPGKRPRTSAHTGNLHELRPMHYQSPAARACMKSTTAFVLVPAVTQIQEAKRGACRCRFAPLSVGRVEGGQLVCRYHGWAFEGEPEGRCVACPQAVDARAEATVRESSRSRLHMYPSQVPPSTLNTASIHQHRSLDVCSGYLLAVKPGASMFS